MRRFVLVIAVASALLGLAACETGPTDDSTLLQAREAVAQAEADPTVARHAVTDLDRARKLLIDAEAAAKEKGAGNVTAAHYAYLATQVARIAEQRAREQIAIERIKAGESERQKILMSALETGQQRLAASLEDMQARQTERGLVLTLGDGLFDTGRAELKPGVARSLDQVVSFLTEHPERSVQIEAFTDSDGTDDFNIELSQTRADTVAMAILRRGVDAERVRALGYGEGFPVASNDSAGSRQLNRRVEIIVSRDQHAIPGRATKGAL